MILEKTLNLTGNLQKDLEKLEEEFRLLTFEYKRLLFIANENPDLIPEEDPEAVKKECKAVAEKIIAPIIVQIQNKADEILRVLYPDDNEIRRCIYEDNFGNYLDDYTILSKEEPFNNKNNNLNGWNCFSDLYLNAVEGPMTDYFETGKWTGNFGRTVFIPLFDKYNIYLRNEDFSRYDFPYDTLDLEMDEYGVLYSKDNSILWGMGEKAGIFTTIECYRVRDGVRIIRNDAFEMKGFFRSIKFPDTLKVIGKAAFRGCELLTNFELPDNVVKIGPRAFMNCPSLQNVTLSSGLTILNSQTFINCSKLKHISIPGKVRYIAPDTFDKNLHFEIEPGNRHIKYENGIISKADNSEVFFLTEEMMEVVIPKGVTTIPASFLYAANYIKSVILPDTVTQIGQSAFMNCSSLEYICLPDSLRYIDDLAFANCSSLKHIDIPDNVKSVGQLAFSRCSSLRSISIGENLITIGALAFDNCCSLKHIYVPDSVVNMGRQVFSLCSDLIDVKIPQYIENISDWMFVDCPSLRSVNIPSSVKILGEEIFENCESLESVYFESIPDKIGSDIFTGCSSLKEIIVPSGMSDRMESVMKECGYSVYIGMIKERL